MGDNTVPKVESGKSGLTLSALLLNSHWLACSAIAMIRDGLERTYATLSSSNKKAHSRTSRFVRILH